MALNMINYWVVGFLWGSARFSGDYLLVQNMNKGFLEIIKKETAIENKIFTTKTHQDKESFRLKIPLSNKYVAFMKANNYEGRMGNTERKTPSFTAKNDEFNFLKGYFITHYTLDTAYNKNRSYKRLRFYASDNILQLLNYHLHDNIGTTIKKVGKHTNNEVCKILYYQSAKEVPHIVDYLDLNKKATYLIKENKL